MNRLTFGRQTIDSILKAAFARAGEPSNASQPRVGDGRALVLNNTALVQRSSEENLDYFYNNLNSDCIYVVLSLLAEKNDILTSDLKTIREVCTLWQKIIDSGLMQQRFIVKLITVKQISFNVFNGNSTVINNLLNEDANIVYHILKYLPLGQMRLICKQFNKIIDDMLASNVNYLRVVPNYKKMLLEWNSYVQWNFSISKNFKTVINLFNKNEMIELLEQIKKKEIRLNNIETISFGKITKENGILAEKLLEEIFLNEEILFSNFRKLTFEEIEKILFTGKIGESICSKTRLIFPKFNKLETLIFKDVWCTLGIIDLPGLKNLKFDNGNIENLKLLKSALKLRGQTKIIFSNLARAYSELRGLIAYPAKKTNLECIETIIIDGIHIDKFQSAQKLICNIIYYRDKQFLKGLKRIEIDNSSGMFELPKFQQPIEVVYFAGSGAKLTLY